MAVSTETNRSEWVVRLNCKGVLEGYALVVQLVVGEELRPRKLVRQVALCRYLGGFRFFLLVIRFRQSR